MFELSVGYGVEDEKGDWWFRVNHKPLAVL
jgi:hypothetical protein